MTKIVPKSVSKINIEPENTYSDFSNIGRKLYSDAGCVTNITYSGSGYSENIGLNWDSQYRLTAVSTNGSECERNGYDALGRRAWNWNGTTTNYMVYDGAHVLAEVDSTGGLRRAYTYGPGIDNWLAMTCYTGATAKTYFYLTDHQGTVHAVADESGSIVESYRFDSWGRVLGVYSGSGTPLTESAIGNRILWQGREYSWSIGIYNLRARWYDPVTGRWLSNDPSGLEGGLNQYCFAYNCPVLLNDPDGENPVVIAAVVLAGILIISNPDTVYAPAPADETPATTPGSVGMLTDAGLMFAGGVVASKGSSLLGKAWNWFTSPKGGHHAIIPDRWSKYLPEWLVDNRANVIKKGATQEAYYKWHYKVDPSFYGTAGWSGKALGLEKYNLAGRLWYGSPSWLQWTAGGLAGADAALWGYNWWQTEQQSGDCK